MRFFLKSLDRVARNHDVVRQTVFDIIISRLTPLRLGLLQVPSPSPKLEKHMSGTAVVEREEFAARMSGQFQVVFSEDRCILCPGQPDQQVGSNFKLFVLLKDIGVFHMRQ